MVRFLDLYKPLGRLAFLALALETERLALKLCQFPSLCERCWCSLGSKKRKTAIEVYRRRNKRDPEREDGKYKPLRELIGFTKFDDKANMISRCRLIPATDLTKIKRHFHTLQNVRNLCAHPSGEFDLEESLPREQLQDHVQSIKDIHSRYSELRIPDF